MIRSTLTLATIVAAFVSRSASAAIAYDTLGPGDSFQVTSWLLGSPNQDQDIAQQFQCWQGGDLQSMTLAITHYAFQNSYDVKLYSDSCGQPGTLLASWLGVQAPEDSLLTLVPDSNVTLAQGMNYWVAVTVPLGGENTIGGWNYDTIAGNNQSFLFSQHGAPWATQCGERCALRVEVAGAAPSCPGDLDGDGAVGLTDLAMLLALFGSVCP